MLIYHFDKLLGSIFLYLYRNSCTRKHLHLQYCSCFSTAFERSSTICVNLEKFSVKLFIVFSFYILSLLECIKLLGNKIHSTARFSQVTFAFNLFFLVRQYYQILCGIFFYFFMQHSLVPSNSQCTRFFFCFIVTFTHSNVKNLQ